MINSQEPHQPNNNPKPPNSTHQRNPGFIPDQQDIFSFLQKEEKSSSSSFPPFFSENGLSQDIIKVTGAEPDICLEVFYALYNTLWAQIENDSDISIKNAWTSFIGSSSVKGSLCPPEKLITERRVRDIKNSLSTQEGEKKIFQYLDKVLSSTSHLKQEILNYPGQLSHKGEIMASLTLVQEFYLGFRNTVQRLVQAILEKEQINAPYSLESDALDDLLEPKAVMMGDIFPYHWAYRISRNQAQKLLSLDRYGHKLQRNLNDPSNHSVVALPEKTPEPLVFFKANGNPPIQPEKEFMVYSLYRHLHIPIPETALVILTDVLEASPSNFYAVQASEAVLGESPLIAYQNKETIFDHEAYVSQVIGAFLTNPSDGLFKNFQYSQKYKHFISIDNDEIFDPELAGKDDRRFVKVKSILYLLPQIDLPISQSTKTFFSTFDPHLMILAWLKDLSQKNRDYQLLFTRLAFQKTRGLYQDLSPSSTAIPLAISLQQKVLVDHEADDEPFYPQILVSQSVLKSLTEKLQILEKTLLTKSSVSAQSLFEEIFPILGKYYRKLRLEFDNPEEAEKVLQGNRKNGVDYSYISSILDSEELSNLSDNQIGSDESQVPEMFVQKFKEKLISRQNALDQFIGRHSLRMNKNVIDLQGALKELRLLIQEGLTHSQSIRDIVDFCSSLSKMVERNPDLIKEITSLLSNLPSTELKWLFTLEEYFIRPDGSGPKDPSSLPVLGAFMKQRTFLLTESENQYLFDQQGNIKKNSSLTGRSSVTYFPEKESQFYLKQYPEWPGYEFASILFMRLLGIQHLPYHDLLIVNSKYPVLLTQAVHGDPVLRIWHKSQMFQNLDPVHTGLLIIAAMLLNPEDGKEDNFILSPDGKYLIPIDNDHCFLPSTFQKEGTFWNAFTVNIALQTKTILFCLDEMYMPIPLEVRQLIQSIDFDELISKWITEVDKIDNQLNHLIDQNQRNKFLEQSTVMRIPFYKQFIHNIHCKAHKIKDILDTASEITPFDLLKTVEPFAAKCYQDSFKQGNSLQKRFKAATDQLYKKTAVDGSRVSILNTRTMMDIINVSEKDLKDEAMFQRMGPVDVLELLDQLSRERIEKVKREQEMLCELDEKKQEKSWISLFGNSQGEAALKDFFANPKEGLIIRGSRLITNNKLKELFAQAPNNGMRIRFLSLPESPLLTDKEIRILVLECPNIEYLNVSGCLKLKQLITREGEWPLLTRLEAKDCINLEKFASFSPMKILRLETDCFLEIFVEKTTLEILTISKKFKILKIREMEFEFSFKRGEKLEINNQSKKISSDDFLHRVICGKEEVQKFFDNFEIKMEIHSILSGKDIGVFITFLRLQNSKIKTQDIQRMVQIDMINLKSLNLSQNPNIGPRSLEYLIQGNWPKLDYLDLSENSITDEGVSILSRGNWPLLEILNLNRTEITIVGVQEIVNISQWPRLKQLDLSSNWGINDGALKVLSHSNWAFLETLGLKYTEVTRANLLHFVFQRKLPSLKKIIFGESRDRLLETFLSPENQSLPEKLDLSSCQITRDTFKVVLNNCNRPQLKTLNLSHNPQMNDETLEILLHTNWPLLETLNLNRTRVTLKQLLHFIYEPKFPNLKQIIFDPYQKKLIDTLLLKSPSLPEELDLRDCNVTQIEIEAIVSQCNWSQLKCLDLSHNEINDEALEILSRGNWPLLQILNICETKATRKGLLNLLSKNDWPNLNEIRCNSDQQNFVASLFRKNWPQLEELDVSESSLTHNEIDTMVNKCNWPQLKHLNLSTNDKITRKGFQTLTQGNWPLLEILNLSKTNMTTIEIKILVNQNNWTNLKYLNISNNRILDEGFEIFSSANWPLLEDFNFQNTGITSKGVETFMSSRSRWPHLKIVHGSHNWIRNQGLEIITSFDWNQLEEINLRNIIIRDKDIKILISKSHWPNLKRLDISDNYIENEGLRILSYGKWPLLESLYLRRINITGNGIQSLASISKWPSLKILDLSDNEIFDEGYNTLKNGNWPLLECLFLKHTDITGNDIRGLFSECSWSYLKEIHFKGLDYHTEAMIDMYRPIISKSCPNVKLILS